MLLESINIPLKEYYQLKKNLAMIIQSTKEAHIKYVTNVCSCPF